MNKKVFIGIATAIALAEYSRYARFVDNISVKPKNFKFNKVGKKLEIKFNLNVTNNSSKAIVINSVDGNIKAKSKVNKSIKIGSYKVAYSTQIDANKVTSLPIVAYIDAENIINNISSFDDLSIFSSITVETKAVVSHKVLGLINMSLPIKNITTVAVSDELKKFDSIISDFKKLFVK